MTKEEFIKQRCEIDKITEEEFKKQYRVVKCYCGQPYCKGYRCLDLDDLLKENKQLKEKLDKYENPEDMTLMMMWSTEKVKDENKQLKDNWDELKEYIKEEGSEVNTREYGSLDVISKDVMIEKMQELEQGSDSNE